MLNKVKCLHIISWCWKKRKSFVKITLFAAARTTGAAHHRKMIKQTTNRYPGHNVCCFVCNSYINVKKYHLTSKLEWNSHSDSVPMSSHISGLSLQSVSTSLSAIVVFSLSWLCICASFCRTQARQY